MNRLASLVRKSRLVVSSFWLPGLIFMTIVSLLLLGGGINISPDLAFWRDAFFTFWTIPRFALWGFLSTVVILGVPLVVVPVLYLLFRAPVVAESTATRSRREFYLAVGGTLTALVIAFASPLVMPGLLADAGLRRVLAVLAGLVPTSFLIGLTQEVIGGSLLYRLKRLAGEPNLDPIFEPDVVPRHGWQTNLDIGSIAPRIGAVVDGLTRWSTVFESSAPSSDTIWTFVRGPQPSPASSPEENAQWVEYSRTTVMERLKRTAWQGADYLRESLGSYLSAPPVPPERIVFLSNTTRAIEAALMASSRASMASADWAAPDVVFFTEFEHGAERGRLEALRHFYGTELIEIALASIIQSAPTRAEASTKVAEVLVKSVAEDPRASKVLLLSHVTFAGGIVLPVREIVREWEQLHRPFALIIDGAHAVGQIDTDICTRADCYVFSGHKWLLGPASLGVLVVGQRFAGSDSHAQSFWRDLRMLAHEGLAFYGADPEGERASTVPLDPFVGLSESLHTIKLHRAKIEERLREVRRVFEVRLAEKDNLRIIRSEKLTQSPGIICVQKRDSNLGYDGLHDVARRLEREHHMVVKVVGHPFPGEPFAIRICLPFYLDRNSIIRFVDAAERAVVLAGP